MLLKISRKMTPHQSQKPLVNNLVLFPFALIKALVLGITIISHQNAYIKENSGTNPE